MCDTSVQLSNISWGRLNRLENSQECKSQQSSLTISLENRFNIFKTGRMEDI